MRCGKSAPGQNSFTAASRWGQHPCGPDVLEIEEFSNPKSTSGLPTYGTVVSGRWSRRFAATQRDQRQRYNQIYRAME